MSQRDLHNPFAGKQDSAEKEVTQMSLTRLCWGYSSVEQHGVSVRNKHPEGNELANALGVVWISKECSVFTLIVETFEYHN